MKKLLLAATMLLTMTQGRSQALYDISTIQTIEINFTQTNWDYLLDTAAAGYETDLMAAWVKINGVQFDSVGVRYKGNSTYSPSQVKNPFHITLDEFKEQDYQGYTDIKLSNVAKDPSFVREVLSYQILRQYMHAPLSNYANVYVNGSLIGLYSNSESVSKSFVDEHFYSKDNAFIKCNPPAGAGPGATSLPKLIYLGTDSTLYYDAYELKSDYGWADLIALTDTLKNYTASVEKILDVDRALWMLAFDNVMVNLDSYLGTFAQNYYLYRDHNGRFNPVIWDLNESFGVFSNTGTSTLSSTTAKQQMTPTLHSADANWPLVQKLLAVPMYKRMYIAHMRTILTENFASGTYYTQAQTLQSLISTSVSSDVNKFFTYAQFTANLNTDVSSGMTNAPGITNLMNARNTWLMAQADFTATAPTISGAAPSVASPAINSSVTISATVVNANSNAVYLGYRNAVDTAFRRVLMYDDGLHNDGASGDNLFGVDVNIQSSLMQYYIYAENNNAGMFSPQRAEHEFYVIYASIPMVNSSEIVINELMAVNNTTATDPAGAFEDWIELYNNTSSYLSLDNLFLSDSYTTPLKWSFPNNTIIAPHDYLIVWADNDTTQSGIHTNFKLSGTGEQLILSYASGAVIDSISYGTQSSDISYQRCPNGTGPFTLTTPTYGTANCIVGINEQDKGSMSVYPNPAISELQISTDKPFDKVEIFNSVGELIFTSQENKAVLTIDVSSFSKGLYIIRADDTISKFIVQ
jgi:hypothetical protein